MIAIIRDARSMDGCLPQTNQERMSAWAAGFFYRPPSERNAPSRITLPDPVLPAKAEAVAGWIAEVVSCKPRLPQ